MDSPEEKPPARSFLDKELTPRGVGILALCFSPVAIYLAVVQPLMAISTGQTPEKPAILSFALACFLPLVGIAYTFFPARAEKALGSWKKEPAPLGWCIWTAVIVLAVGSYLAMKAHVAPYRENAARKPAPTSNSD